MKLRVSLFLLLFLGSLFSVTIWILFPATLLENPKKTRPLEHWLELLRSPDILLRIQAITQLGAMGTSANPTIPALIETDIPLNSEYFITEALQKMGKPSLSLTSSLLSLAQSSNPRIKSRALNVLGDLPSLSLEVESVLLEALRAEQEEVVLQGLRIIRLHQLSSPKLIHTLLELLHTQELRLGEETSYTLITLGPSIVPVFLEQISKDLRFQQNVWRIKILGSFLNPPHPDPVILQHLLSGISEMTPGIKHEILRHLRLLLEKAPSSRALLVELLPEETWLEFFKDSDWQVCEVATDFMSQYEILSGDYLLQELSTFPDWVIRVGILRTVGKMRLYNRKAIPYLIQTLGDSNQDVCQSALLILNKVGPPSPDSTLEIIPLLRSPSWRVRAYGALALGQIETKSRELREKIIDALISTLFDPELDVRFRSVEALGTIGAAAKKSIPYIEESLNMLSNSIVTEEMKRVLEILKKSSKSD